jgi:hypothetical protein
MSTSGGVRGRGRQRPLLLDFPQAKRQVLAKALAKLKAFQTKAVETASKRLDDPKLDLHLEQILSGDGLPVLTPGDSSGNSPASSASSPAL